MKKITFLIPLLLITTVTFGQELITNGGFETGVTTGNPGWNLSYGVDAVQATDVVGAGTTHSGTYAGRALNWGTGATSFLQLVDVTPGETYIVNFWFTFSDFLPSTNVVIRDLAGGQNLVLTPIVPDNGRNAVNNVQYGCGIANQNPSYAWKEAKFSFTVPAGVTQVRFQYYNNNVGYFKYIDDVSIVSNSLSVEDLMPYNLKIYPNPAKDFVKLSASQPISKIEVFDILGKQVLRETINSIRTEVNIANLPKGLYIMKVFIGETIGSFKIIKE
ncbi:MAG: T9SS type A sorting domain-containing protein [Flavobacteriaceae bacterium]